MFKPVKKPVIEPVAKPTVTAAPKVDNTVRASNPSEVVVNGKLYKSVAYQEEGPHSPAKHKLVEVK